MPNQSASEFDDSTKHGSTEDSKSDAERLTASFDQDEESLWRRHRAIWWATLLGPVLVTALLIAAVYVVSGSEYTSRLLTAAATGMLLFGRFIILAGHDPEVAKVTGSLSSGQLVLMVTYLDLIVATILLFHAGFLFRLPWFGSRARALVDDGRFLIHSQPWLRRTAFCGLVLFVAIPLAAMGSVGGTIFGRMLGVDRPRVFLAILLGSLLGNGVMWLGSDLVNQFVDKQHPIVRYGGVLLILLLVVMIEAVYRHTKRQSQSALQNGS